MMLLFLFYIPRNIIIANRIFLVTWLIQ